MLRYNNHILAWVAEWYTRESQKLVAVMALRVRVSPQAHGTNINRIPNSLRIG